MQGLNTKALVSALGVDDVAKMRARHPVNNLECWLNGEDLGLYTERQARQDDAPKPWQAFLKEQEWTPLANVLLLMLAAALSYFSMAPLEQTPVISTSQASFDTSVFSDDVLDLSVPETPAIEEWQALVGEALAQAGASKHVKVLTKDDEVVMHVKARVFFNAGSDQLARSGVALLESLSPMLLALNRNIEIALYSDARALTADGRLGEHLRTSQSRAVVDYFDSVSLPKGLKISAEAYGEDKGQSADPGLWSQRVSFRLTRANP